MFNFRKLLAVLVVSLATLFASGLSHANTVSFTFDGTATTGTILPGGAVLPDNSTITVTGFFDDSPLTAGIGTILFNDTSSNQNTLSIDFAGLYTLTHTDDSRWPSGNDGASLTFGTSGLTSFDYRNTILASFNLLFDDNGSPAILNGSWDPNTFSLVPVPAAVWLFGSGLIGLAGVARRKSRT